MPEFFLVNPIQILLLYVIESDLRLLIIYLILLNSKSNDHEESLIPMIQILLPKSRYLFSVSAYVVRMTMIDKFKANLSG